ncbi:MAG: T9SS type A sorting domain-containing protein [Ignavibacteria bacterium]|nr:T9SS type A sorting domain-containing protein [Ignavibacteria bacterium]
MKNIIYILLFIISFNLSFATTHIVQVSNYAFTPQNLNVTVGDTIKWVWVSGIHTTTSTTIPQGATPWDVIISSSNQTYSYPVVVPGLYNYVCTPHIPMGMVGSFNASPSNITPIAAIAYNYELFQNYPNPFNPTTKIRFSIPKSEFVTLKIYNVVGEEIAVLVNKFLNQGIYEYEFNANNLENNLSSGVYFYTLRTESYQETKKLLLSK